MKLCIIKINKIIKDINIKKHTQDFFNDIMKMMSIKKFDPNNIKIDEKLYKNILTCYVD